MTVVDTWDSLIWGSDGVSVVADWPYWSTNTRMRLFCTSVSVSSARRASAALGERESSSGPSTLRSRAMLGTITLPGPKGPGMVCEASCGNQENQSHSPR